MCVGGKFRTGGWPLSLITPEGAPLLSRFLRQGGAFDFLSPPRFPSLLSSAPSIGGWPTLSRISFPRVPRSCRVFCDRAGLLTSYPQHDSHLFSLPRRPWRLNFHHSFHT